MKTLQQLVNHCFDEERKQDWLLCRINTDTEHLPGLHSSKDFAYLAWGMATIIEAHKRINSFCYLSKKKRREKITRSYLFSFEMITHSSRSVSCYSRAEESENQCMMSVCI